MELVLRYRFLGERRDLFFGLSLVLRKSPPFANDFSARWSASMFVTPWFVWPSPTAALQIGRSSNGGGEPAASERPISGPHRALTDSGARYHLPS